VSYPIGWHPLERRSASLDLDEVLVLQQGLVLTNAVVLQDPSHFDQVLAQFALHACDRTVESQDIVDVVKEPDLLA
jgi:hypothetical protein